MCYNNNCRKLISISEAMDERTNILRTIEDVSQKLISKGRNNFNANDIGRIIFPLFVEAINCERIDLPKEKVESLASLYTNKLITAIHCFSCIPTDLRTGNYRQGVNMFLPELDNELSNFFDSHVNRLQNKYNQNPDSDFHQHVSNISPENNAMKKLGQIISKTYFKGIAKVSVGGQVKLHPPGVNDINSINWHYDGDPAYFKILIILEKCIEGDGEFQYVIERSGQVELNQMSIKCVAYDELKSCIENLSVLESSHFGVYSHMEHKLATTETVITVPGVRHSSVLFHGASVLHRGGSNNRKRRPIFQGLVSLEN